MCEGNPPTSGARSTFDGEQRAGVSAEALAAPGTKLDILKMRQYPATEGWVAAGWLVGDFSVAAQG